MQHSARPILGMSTKCSRAMRNSAGQLFSAMPHGAGPLSLTSNFVAMCLKGLFWLVSVSTTGLALCGIALGNCLALCGIALDNCSALCCIALYWSRATPHSAGPTQKFKQNSPALAKSTKVWSHAAFLKETIYQKIVHR
jgi:hypothetical protein